MHRCLLARDLAHKDIKPENVLFADRSLAVCKLCGFGHVTRARVPAAQCGMSAKTAAHETMSATLGAAVRGMQPMQEVTVVHGIQQFCPTCQMRAYKAIFALETVLWCDRNRLYFIYLTLRPYMGQQPVEDPTAASHRLAVWLVRPPLSAGDALWLAWLNKDRRVCTGLKINSSMRKRVCLRIRTRFLNRGIYTNFTLARRRQQIIATL
jgi:serine/threonine protein kinase